MRTRPKRRRSGDHRAKLVVTTHGQASNGFVCKRSGFRVQKGLTFCDLLDSILTITYSGTWGSSDIRKCPHGYLATFLCQSEHQQCLICPPGIVANSPIIPMQHEQDWFLARQTGSDTPVQGKIQHTSGHDSFIHNQFSQCFGAQQLTTGET